MAREEIGEKKYVVRLSGEERAQLESMLSKGKHSAKTLVKARILPKAEVSEGGEGMSDGEIIEQLVEEGFDAVLTRKRRSRPSVPRIFDGEKEAKLIALSCSAPPEGYARWTLRLLERKVVELAIVDAASDSTIGRVLKKHSTAPSQAAVGHSSACGRGFRRRYGGRARSLSASA